MAYEIDYVKNFTGGENNWSAPDNLLDGEMMLCDNVELMGRGGFSKRSGISPTIHFNSGTNPEDWIINYSVKYAMENGSDWIISVCSNITTGDRILTKSINLDGTNYPPTTIYTFPTTAQPFGIWTPTHAIYKHKLYLIIGEMFLVYNGNTVAEVTNANTDSNLETIKGCKYLTQYGERLFAAKGDYLYYSERGNPTYWKTTSILYIDTDEGDYITALIPFKNNLVVFRKSSIYVWEGYDLLNEVTFYRLNTNIGTLSNLSVQQVENSVYFLGEDGIYALYSTDKNVISTVRISNNITTKFKSLKNGIRVSETATISYGTTGSIYFDSKYIICIEGTVFVYNTNVNTENGGAWRTYSFNSSLNENTTDKRFILSNFIVYDNKLCFSCRNSIYKFIDNTYKDSAYVNGQLVEAPINLHVKLRPLAQNEYVNLKKYRKGYIVMQQYMDKQSSCTVKANVDYFETSATMSPDEALIYDNDGRSWDNNVWDFTDVITRGFPIKATGKRLLIDISDNTINNTITIYGVGVEYKVKKPDRG